MTSKITEEEKAVIDMQLRIRQIDSELEWLRSERALLEEAVERAEAQA